MVSEKYKRRHYLINKRFQLKYTLSILGIIVAVMTVSIGGIYIGMWSSIIENFSEFKVSQDLETAKRIAGYEDVRYKKGDYRIERIFREAELLSSQQREALKNALNAVNRSLFPKIALLAVFIFAGGIFISHKIAGPMYRFEHSAAAAKEGDLTVHFNIRKSDEMKNTASVLEDMIETLRSDMQKIKDGKSRLEEEINSIGSTMPSEAIDRLNAIIGEINNVLSKYRT